jgi:hypothetical protein
MLIMELGYGEMDCGSLAEVWATFFKLPAKVSEPPVKWDPRGEKTVKGICKFKKTPLVREINIPVGVSLNFIDVN